MFFILLKLTIDNHIIDCLSRYEVFSWLFSTIVIKFVNKPLFQTLLALQMSHTGNTKKKSDCCMSCFRSYG